MENKLITKNEITSLELLAEINKFRKEEGIKKELLHKSLLDIIRDEFSEEIDRQKILPMSYKDRYGRNQPMFILTLSQARQVLVRESKFVRRAVIHVLEKLENQGLENKEQKKLPFQVQEIKPTTWRGTPVIEVQDLAKLTNITDATIHWYSRNEKINLRYENLQEYKKENSDKDYTNISAISVLYKEMVISLCKKYGVYEKYKDFIENYFRTDNRLEYKVIDKPFNDKYYNEMYECMVKAYQLESQIEKIYEEQLLPLYNRIDKLNDLKRDTMLTPFYGMKYGNIFGRNKK